MKKYIPLALIVGSFVTVASAQQPVSPVVKLTLPDQFEQKHDIAQYRGHVVVLLYGDRAGMPSNRELGEKLHVDFHPAAKGLPPGQAHRVPPRPLPNLPADKVTPDVFVIPVAVIGKVPKLVQNLIRGQVKNGAPEVPVWLDFEDRMKQNFGLTEGVPNMVVIDGWGRVRFQAAGMLDAAKYQRMAQVVEYLRNEVAGLVQPPK